MPITHKRGDTFDYQGPITDLAGKTFDPTGWQAHSQMRDLEGNLIQTFECSWPVPGVSVVRIFASNTDVADWPIGNHFVDVEFTDPTGRKVSTPTDRIKVKTDASR